MIQLEKLHLIKRSKNLRLILGLVLMFASCKSELRPVSDPIFKFRIKEAEVVIVADSITGKVTSIVRNYVNGRTVEVFDYNQELSKKLFYINDTLVFTKYRLEDGGMSWPEVLDSMDYEKVDDVFPTIASRNDTLWVEETILPIEFFLTTINCGPPFLKRTHTGIVAKLSSKCKGQKVEFKFFNHHGKLTAIDSCTIEI